MTKNEKIERILDVWTDAIDLNDLIAFYREKTREELTAMKVVEINEVYKQNVE